MRPPLRPVAVLMVLGLAACGDVRDSADPLAPDLATPGLAAAQAEALHTFLAPTTVVRGQGAPETVPVDLTALDFSRYMDPFVLTVAPAFGDRRVVGSVVLDDVELVGTRDLAGEAVELEIPLTPSSTLTVELLGAPGTAVTLGIDAAVQPPPTIVLSSLPRAAMLVAEAGSTIEAAGEACHVRFPISDLVVMGAAVEVSGTELCEPFVVSIDAPLGLGIIDVTAENDRGRAGRLVQGFLASPSYGPVAFTSTDAARVPDGAYGRFNQPMIDRFADFLETQLNALDVNAVIPQTIFRQDLVEFACISEGFEVLKRGTVTAGARTVSLDATSEGLVAAGGIASPHAPLSVSGYHEWDCTLLTGTASATVNGSVSANSVAADQTLRFAVSGSSVHVSPSSLGSARVLGPQLNVDLGSFNFIESLVDGMVNFVLGFFVDRLNDALKGFLRSSEVLNVLEDLANSFAVSDLSGTAEVNGVALTVDMRAHSARHGSGFLDLGRAVQVMPATPPAEPRPGFGPIRAGGAVPSFTTAGYDAGAALADDLVNQLLWVAWQASAFEVPDVEDATGLDLPGIRASVSALLPPVVGPGDGEHLFELGWGDLAVNAFVDPGVFGLPHATDGEPVAMQAFGSARLGLSVDYDEATDRLRVTALDADVRIQLDAGDALLDEVAVAAELEAALEGLFTALVPGAIAAVPVPALNVGGIAGIPEGTVWRVRDATLDREGRYLRLTGSFE